MAKALLPANSPWLNRIEQAANLAQGFSPSKDGIGQLMAKYGKNREDLQSAIKQLDNPIAKKFLSHIPGLDSQIRNAANELSHDIEISAKNPPVQEQVKTDIPSTGMSLEARLKALK